MMAIGCLKMLKGGLTAFADMYFLEKHVAKAVKKADLRAVLTQGIPESVCGIEEEILKDCVNLP